MQKETKGVTLLRTENLKKTTPNPTANTFIGLGLPKGLPRVQIHNGWHKVRHLGFGRLNNLGEVEMKVQIFRIVLRQTNDFSDIAQGLLHRCKRTARSGNFLTYC